MTYGVIYINGEPCPVTNMFDIMGEETSDKSECESVLVHSPDDKWIVIQSTADQLYPVQ